MILGHDVVKDADAVRHVIGYMPDFFGVYKDMEVTEYLDFFGACYRIPSAQREKTVNDVLELVGLSEKKGALIGALSRGMQQRLGLARVLIHDPQLLLLDEPASGLDPRARIEMMAILRELQRIGKTIIISSHILSELETHLQSRGDHREGPVDLRRAGAGRARSDVVGPRGLGARGERHGAGRGVAESAARE